MAVLNYITDKKSLEKTLSNILEKVIDNVANKLLEDFREHLDETIYSASKGTYQRLYDKGGFYSGWTIKKEQKSAIKGYIKSLGFQGGLLDAPSQYNDFAHGGYNGRDQRGNMPWILNDITSNNDYSHSGGARYLDDTNIGYWDSYMRDIDNKIMKWLDDEFKKYGITRG